VDDFTRKSKPNRLKILSDIRALLKETPSEDRARIPTLVVQEVERILQSRRTITAMGRPLAAKARSKHTMKVTGEAGCVGTSGAGVRVTIGDVNVGACVTGTLSDRPTGGGVSGGFSY
jgi:hypothetical protein